MHFAPNFAPKVAEDAERQKANDDVDFAWNKDDADNSKFYSDKIDALRSTYAGSQAATKFDWSSLGQCAQAPYGYDSNEPCVFLRLNKV